MPSNKLALEYSDFMQLSKFTEKWGRELSKAEYQTQLMNQEVVDIVSEYIAEEIRIATSGDKFGEFMAARTYVEARQTTRGITFDIKGYNEKEMKDRGHPGYRLSEKAEAEGKDWNLWEQYEFYGRGIRGVTLGEPKTKSSNNRIVKDVGGIVTIKKKSGETQDLKGRAGLITAVVSQLKGELAMKLADVIGSAVAGVVAETAHTASQRTGSLPGMDKVTAKAVRQIAKRHETSVSKLQKSGVNVTLTSGGRITTRASKGTPGAGRFVSSAIHGQKVDVVK